MALQKISSKEELEKTIKSQAEHIGRNLCETNDTYSKIVVMMEHPEFRDFYDKYLSKPSNRDIIIIFLNIYEMIDKTSPELTAHQKIAILDCLIKNKDTRPKLIKMFSQHS